MRIWFLASEIVPFAKTGGLADVAASLGRYLGAAGHDVRLCMPLYRAVRTAGQPLEPLAGLADVPCLLGSREYRFSVLVARLPGSEAPVYLLDCAELFERDGLYGEGPDEHLRFGFFARASLVVCQWLGWAPDVVHCHDWHAALAPLYLRAHFGWDRLFGSTRSLLTIHNIAFQGIFPAGAIDELGLADMRRLLPAGDLERGRLNFLRAGILHADRLSTVSPTYAREIQGPELGMGLEAELAARRDVLEGILNGVDYGEWDPRHDARIAARFGPADLSGKELCRRDLLARARLVPAPDGPVLGLVSRLAWQKGIELVLEVLPAILQRADARVVVLGSGDGAYEDALRALAARFPGRMAFQRGYDEDLAHRIEAGADIFLMPSRYEPCGLNQLYSLRYGTVPIVRRTGGLADSVEPYAPGNGAAEDSGTGFWFEPFDAAAFLVAIEAALALYREPERWRALMRRGMGQDFSWQTEGARYEQLYRRTVEEAR